MSRAGQDGHLFHLGDPFFRLGKNPEPEILKGAETLGFYDGVKGFFLRQQGGLSAWADRHHDFRYLLFDVGREDMLDAAHDRPSRLRADELDIECVGDPTCDLVLQGKQISPAPRRRVRPAD
jgi:hypothetical protein